MEVYAVYREVAAPLEQPLFITSSFDMARRKAKTYPNKTKIVSRVVNMGYGVEQVSISGQLKQYQYRGQNLWTTDTIYRINNK